VFDNERNCALKLLTELWSFIHPRRGIESCQCLLYVRHSRNNRAAGLLHQSQKGFGEKSMRRDNQDTTDLHTRHTGSFVFHGFAESVEPDERYANAPRSRASMGALLSYS
jgi:hypothetical protein